MFLELFFTPKNTPPKFKKSKMGLNRIFLGHPVAKQTFFGTPCMFLKGNENLVPHFLHDILVKLFTHEPSDNCGNQNKA